MSSQSYSLVGLERGTGQLNMQNNSGAFCCVVCSSATHQATVPFDTMQYQP